MEWAQIRQRARGVVHNTFALTGRYYSTPGVGIGVPVCARVHSKIVTIGDLQNEGFPRALQDTENLVFLASTVAELGIKRGGVVVLDDGRHFRLMLRSAVLDDYTVTYQVTRA